jgi:hypothetical protein
VKKLSFLLFFVFFINVNFLFAQRVVEQTVEVGPTRPITNIADAISSCDANVYCEIVLDAGTYNEQVSIYNKMVWLHGDLDDPSAVTIRYLDTLSTWPHDNNDGENNYLLYPDRNGVIRVREDSVRISHLTIDATRKFAFQWEDVWGAEWQFYGNAGVTLAEAKNVQIDHCEFINAWYAVYVKGRNMGGVYANLESWEIDAGATTTPFSDFGLDGGHIIEYNRIHDNVWAFFMEQNYDLGSTFRYNLIWDNYSESSDFICNSYSICGNPNNGDGDKKYHNGGMAFMKDAMLVTHSFYNNTLWNLPHVLAGYHKTGKNHLAYNNIIAHHTARLDTFAAEGQASEVFGGMSNAHHNVMERNGANTFPLFATADVLWDSPNLVLNGAASPDSFEIAEGNFYYAEVDFLNTDDPSNDNFLCPNWESDDVVRTIAGKGYNILEGMRTNENADVGALWDNGAGGCREGGSSDSIGIHLHAITPIIFYDQENATFQFSVSGLNAPDSAFSPGSYHYAAYIDSMPYTATGTSLGAYPEAEPLPGSSGLIGAVQIGHNEVSIVLPRSSLAEYGVLYLAVMARHENGNDYISNIEMFEYRRLDYTIDLKIYANDDDDYSHPLDTVAKGDTIVLAARLLDLNLDIVNDPDIVFTGTTQEILGVTSYRSPEVRTLLNNSFTISDQFDSIITGTGYAKAIVTGATWGNEIVTIGGVVRETIGAATTTKFASGTHLLYINPAYASELEIEANDTLYAGDTVSFTVNVRDVFDQLSGDSVMINLTSDDLNQAQVIFPNQMNTDGTLDFNVVLHGAPQDSITLTASATSEAGDISTTFSAPLRYPPGAMVFTNDNDSTLYVTGDVAPLSVQFEAYNGTDYATITPFTFSVYNSDGTPNTDMQLWTDSAAMNAGYPDNMNGTAQMFMLSDSTGAYDFWISMPDTVSSSDWYTLVLSSTGIGVSSQPWDTLYVGFEVPHLVFIDEDGNEYDELPPINDYTNQYQSLRVEARLGDQLCTVCQDTLLLSGGDSTGYIRFKEEEGEADITSIVMEDGVAEFVVYGRYQVENTSFTISGRGGAMEETWDEITFLKPPVPQVDSAFVYDSNGDGIADSVLVYYETDISDSLPDSVYYAFPGSDDSPEQVYPSNEIIPASNPNMLILSGTDLTDAIETDGVGLLQSWYTDSEGVIWRQPVDIEDRMGPVIISASVVENYTGDPDSLVVVFSEPVDSNFVNGYPFAFTDSTGREQTPAATALQVDDSTWVFVMQNGIANQGSDIALNPTGGITDLNGNAPSANNNPVEIDVLRRPIPATQQGNTFQDLDGDGRLDHIALTFYGEITQDYLDNDLDSVGVSWLDSAGNVITVNIPGSDFTIDPDNPRVITYDIEDQSIFQDHMTWIDEDADEPYGTATMYTSIDDVERTAAITMTDAMPPIIWQALLEVGENVRDDDIMTLYFSEPVDHNSIPAEMRGSEFEILFQGAEQEEILQYTEIEWQNNSTEAVLTFGRNVSYNSRPNSLDEIRLSAGSIPDEAGNFPLSDAEFAANSPDGSSRPFTMIRGGVRFRLETINLTAFDPTDPALASRDAMDMLFLDMDTQREERTELGVMIGLGGESLVFDIQNTLKEKKYSDDDNIDPEDIEVVLENIKVHMELHVFTSLSGYVSHISETISCTDSRFSALDNPGEGDNGDCVENPRKVFIRWNYKADNGRYAGAGAYIAQKIFRVTYTDPEKGKITLSERDELNTWGVQRVNGTTIIE